MDWDICDLGLGIWSLCLKVFGMPAKRFTGTEFQAFRGKDSWCAAAV